MAYFQTTVFDTTVLEKITKSLTYAEYQALSEEEKNNGTIYLITDVNGDGQNFQPVIYSEEEREIGVWKDGKPLYEKTVDCGALPNNSSKQVAHGITNIDKIVNVTGIAYSTSLGTALQLAYPQKSSNSDYVVEMSVNDTNIDISTFRNRTSFNGYVTLRYTKSTDAAGSGTWTPQGVPAVHYSTDEQVIGTWIDGKTLYEKTFYSTTVVSYSTDTALVVNDTIPTGIEIVDLKARLCGVSGVSPYPKYTVADGYWFTIYHEGNSNEFRAHQILTSGGLTSCMTYVTIQYTKTST